MSFESAKKHLIDYGFEDRIMEFSVSSATVHDAAIALKCLEKNIAKTLSFMVNDRAILILVAGDQKIDNSKYKSEFGVKAKMIPSSDVEKVIGHSVGGVCPFGIHKDVDVYLDKSLKRLEYVFPACGSSNSAVKLNIQELEKASIYLKWVDVCKNK